MTATHAVGCGATEVPIAQGSAHFLASSKQTVPFPQGARDLRAEDAAALTHLVAHVTSYRSSSGAEKGCLAADILSKDVQGSS